MSCSYLPASVHGASITVPNCTATQKSAVLRVMHRIPQTTTMRAWEKQAIRKVSRVVGASPHSVQTVFSKLSTTMDWGNGRPACTCSTHLSTAQAHGTLMDTEGHTALIPIRITDELGNVLQPRDQLPVTGRIALDAATKGITAFVRQVHGTVPDHDRMLPPSLFPNTGHTLRRVRHIAEQLSRDVTFGWWTRVQGRCGGSASNGFGIK